MPLQANARVDLGRRIAAVLRVPRHPRGYRRLIRAEAERKLPGKRLTHRDLRAINRQRLLQAHKRDNPELAAAMANTCAATVREQGGDPTYFQHRARELYRHNLRPRIATDLRAHLPRRPRARARGCGRPPGRSRVARTSGSRGDPHSAEGDGDPPGPAARLRAPLASSGKGAA